MKEKLGCTLTRVHDKLPCDPHVLFNVGQNIMTKITYMLFTRSCHKVKTLCKTCWSNNITFVNDMWQRGHTKELRNGCFLSTGVTIRKLCQKEPQPNLVAVLLTNVIHSRYKIVYLFWVVATKILKMWGPVIYCWKGLRNTLPMVYYMFQKNLKLQL